MLLALTCSSSVGSVTISNGKNFLKTLSWESERSHAEYVSQKIAELTTDYPLASLKALAVDVGPGSFTGIRIAVNTIKTLSYALNLPVVTANSLELLCHQVPLSTVPTICLIDAYSQSVYASVFENINDFWTARFEPKAVKSLEIKSLFKSKSLCLGDGLKKYSKEVETIQSLVISNDRFTNFPTSEILSDFAHKKLKNNLVISWRDLEPLYIRRSSAEEKLLV